MANTFQCVAHFRSHIDGAVLPYCALTPTQTSKWNHILLHVHEEAQKVDLSSAGAPMKRSNGVVYCGRLLGVAAIPGSDGRCEPNNGAQCDD
jgi:hypothetical protein